MLRRKENYYVLKECYHDLKLVGNTRHIFLGGVINKILKSKKGELL